MSAGPAPLILAGITALAVTVWLYAAFYLINTPAIAAKRPGEEPSSVEIEPATSSGAPTIVGIGEIEGDAPELSAKLASRLARDGLFQGGGPIEIVERRDDRIAFQTPGEPRKPRGEILLSPAGPGRTSYRYRVEDAELSTFLKIGWVIQAVGLIVMAILYWVIHSYVATSTIPALKFQTVQMLQCSHLLWPPFLFGALYRRGKREIASRFDALAHNLPYLGE